ncbi:unnamed protein product [Bursaphelenchus okinawaensis]|uniref:Potassium channel domain-containing protein n=1 Tax=Bursaphelenchus okinawaensis TaxID=465554 RepID=A0A811JTI9_9BILA|nr:unnamed protein product [Bursaphelenchus okinawaensis]CAG9081906.1 unnamed protein product [Bursaphelenchus okinawaensis]
MISFSKVGNVLKGLMSSPSMLMLLILSFYLLFGAATFSYLENTFNYDVFNKNLLFCFTTLTTIGYGNVLPTTLTSMVVCSLYIIFGTPFLFATFSRCSGVLTRIYSRLFRSSHEKIPLSVSILLLLLYSLVVGLLMTKWVQLPSLIAAFYFGFVSITTIGFGDFYIVPNSITETVTIIGIQSIGICLMSILISNICSSLKRFNYMGRELFTTPSEGPFVWINGAKFTIKELLMGVSTHFDASPQKLKSMLIELDALLSMDSDDNNLLKNETTKVIFASSFSDVHEHKKMLHALATVTNLSLSGQKTIRKHDPTIRELLQYQNAVNV